VVDVAVTQSAQNPWPSASPDPHPLQRREVNQQTVIDVGAPSCTEPQRSRKWRKVPISRRRGRRRQNQSSAPSARDEKWCEPAFYA
jgi:hypothetical protein